MLSEISVLFQFSSGIWDKVLYREVGHPHLSAQLITPWIELVETGYLNIATSASPPTSSFERGNKRGS